MLITEQIHIFFDIITSDCFTIKFLHNSTVNHNPEQRGLMESFICNNIFNKNKIKREVD